MCPAASFLALVTGFHCLGLLILQDVFSEPLLEGTPLGRSDSVVLPELAIAHCTLYIAVSTSTIMLSPMMRSLEKRPNVLSIQVYILCLAGERLRKIYIYKYIDIDRYECIDIDDIDIIG